MIRVRAVRSGRGDAARAERSAERHSPFECELSSCSSMLDECTLINSTPSHRCQLSSAPSLLCGCVGWRCAAMRRPSGGQRAQSVTMPVSSSTRADETVECAWRSRVVCTRVLQHSHTPAHSSTDERRMEEGWTALTVAISTLAKPGSAAAIGSPSHRHERIGHQHRGRNNALKQT